MKWSQLLCTERQRRHSTAGAVGDYRNEFQKDYHRIICSASFRRLQDKTQVFPLDNSDFVRTRLTHSLEVASFAKSLGHTAFGSLLRQGIDEEITGEVVESCSEILECAGLLHDIGNPPFGHFGEDSIRSWFEMNLDKQKYKGQPLSSLLNEQMRNDLLHFEGNAQALRLVSKLHFLVDENGMNLTFALLHTLVKYPVSSCEADKSSPDIKYHKMGYYLAEQELFDSISRAAGTNGARYPLTFLLEAADDIAYKTADIEDAVKKGKLTYYVLLDELRRGGYRENCGNENEFRLYDEYVDKLEGNYESAVSRGISDPELNAVQNWIIGVQRFLLLCASDSFISNYRSIMDGTFPTEILSVSDGNALARALGKIAYKHVFRSRHILKSEISAGSIIDFLLDRFIPASVHNDGTIRLTPMEDKLVNIISDNYRQIYSIFAENADEQYRLYLRILLVTDYICGMTDSYAKRLYQEFYGII